MPTFASTADLGAVLGEELVGARLTQAVLALELATTQIQVWTRQRIERVVDDTITLAGTSSWELELPERPVISATVTGVDGVEIDEGSYRLFEGILVRPGGWAGSAIYSANWPTNTGYPSTVEVTYTHGYDPIPDDIRAVCIQLAARGLQAPTGGVRQESIGNYSVSYGDVNDANDPLLSTLSRYRRRVAAVKLR